MIQWQIKKLDIDPDFLALMQGCVFLFILGSNIQGGQPVAYDERAYWYVFMK